MQLLTIDAGLVHHFDIRTFPVQFFEEFLPVTCVLTFILRDVRFPGMNRHVRLCWLAMELGTWTGTWIWMGTL